MSQHIPIPDDPLKEMLHTLDLEDAGGARTREDIFVGPSQWMPHGRVFGGQVLAQSLVAATRTVELNRPVHSLHGYFLRPGDIELPITFSVDRLRDGRSFSTRRVQAYQKAEPIFSMIASFQESDPGLVHQVEMPTGIPDPESLPERGFADRRKPAPRCAVLGKGAALRYATRSRPDLLSGRERARGAPGSVVEVARFASGQPRTAHLSARLCQ